MSSGVLSSAKVHDLQVLSASCSPTCANTVHQFINTPSVRLHNELQWMLNDGHFSTLLLNTASCALRMRVTAFLNSLFMMFGYCGRAPALPC